MSLRTFKIHHYDSNNSFIVFDESASKAKYVCVKAARDAGYGEGKEGMRRLFIGMSVRLQGSILFDPKRHKPKFCYAEAELY